MDADGSRRVQLTRGPVQRPSFPAWSPDGTRIAYAWTDLSHWPSWPGIFLINPDGTDPVRISQPFLPSAGWERPAWSPDGLKLAYLAETAREIVIVNLAGGSVEHLPLDRDARNLAWSPDGVFIAFDEPCPEPMYPSPEYCLTNPIWLVRVSDGRVLPTSVQWGWGPAWVP
jgi:Tol biopolymer transport system component